uniref:Flavodoxin-like domain-containing protein n=1 Tax=Guillardia theta TaxID=55529 RepID=A0A7S4JEY2_GUITH
MAQGRRLLVLYGSQTGTAEEMAVHGSSRLALAGAAPICKSLSECSLQSLQQAEAAVFVVSTTGDGEAPLTMRRFWMTLRKRDLDQACLANLSYAVYGCGDSSYPKFNAVARRLDIRLQALGAKRLCDVVLGDEQSPLGVAQGLSEWTDRIASKLKLLHSDHMDKYLHTHQAMKYFLGSRDGASVKRKPMDFSDYEETVHSLSLCSQIVLFANGNPLSKQMCSGTKNAFSLLRLAGLSFSYFDTSLDQEIRESLTRRFQVNPPFVCGNGSILVSRDELRALEENITLGELSLQRLMCFQEPGDRYERSLNDDLRAGDCGENRTQHMWDSESISNHIPGIRESILKATVKFVSTLTKGRDFDVNDVRHVELKLPNEYRYKAGNVALIMPRNRPCCTERFLRLLRLNGNTIIDSINVSNSSFDFLLNRLNFRLPCTVREIVSSQLVAFISFVHKH